VCADTWAGTATYIAKTPGLPAANIASHSTITWTVDPAQSSGRTVVYKASGSFDLAINSPDNCTITLSPRTFTIVDDPASPTRLILFDDGFNPPTYMIAGGQRVDTTSTFSCPGKSDVVSHLNGFLVLFASGNGPYVVGQTTLEGHTDDAATTSSWSFSRP
jgi:hypothetical protein